MAVANIAMRGLQESGFKESGTVLSRPFWRVMPPDLSVSGSGGTQNQSPDFDQDAETEKYWPTAR